MQMSHVIETFTKRRDWMLDKLAQTQEQSAQWHGLRQQIKAIETALPVLEQERERRQRAFMDRAEPDAAR